MSTLYLVVDLITDSIAELSGSVRHSYSIGPRSASPPPTAASSRGAPSSSIVQLTSLFPVRARFEPEWRSKPKAAYLADAYAEATVKSDVNMHISEKLFQG